MRLRTPSSPLFGLGRIIYFIFYFVTWIAIVRELCRARIRRNLLARRWCFVLRLARGSVVFHSVFLATCPAQLGF